MWYSVVVYHNEISFFPTIENHVLPGDISYVFIVGIRYLGTIPITRVKTTIHCTNNV